MSGPGLAGSPTPAYAEHHAPRRESHLAVRCDFDERDARMAADPKAFFITDHDENYPAVCVRLAAVKAADLKSVLESAWRREAGRKLVQDRDGKASSRSSGGRVR